MRMEEGQVIVDDASNGFIKALDIFFDRIQSYFNRSIKHTYTDVLGDAITNASATEGWAADNITTCYNTDISVLDIQEYSWILFDGYPTADPITMNTYYVRQMRGMVSVELINQLYNKVNRDDYTAAGWGDIQMPAPVPGNGNYQMRLYLKKGDPNIYWSQNWTYPMEFKVFGVR